MANNLKIDFVGKKLVMDRTFAKNASNVRSEEYRLLTEAKANYPSYEIVTKTIARNSAKESYSGLTYAYMEDYIMTHEDPENVMKVLHEFEEMQLISRCHSKAFRYPTIKKWFLERYPEIVKFGMPKPSVVVPVESLYKKIG